MTVTALAHPNDRRALIIQAARDEVARQAEADAARRAERAEAAVAHHLPDIMRLLEEYGADTTAGTARHGVCADPAHALAWITTAEGFEFEITDGPDSTCWLLHPETGARLMRVDWQTRWAHAAERIVAELDRPAPEPRPPADDHPADRLVAALRDFVRAIDERNEATF